MDINIIIIISKTQKRNLRMFSQIKNRINDYQLIKIHFSIHKHVEFGKAVYVVGNIPQLGFWNLSDSLRLSWAQTDEWSGYIYIEKNFRDIIEFKYAIGSWENPGQFPDEWERGFYNRKLKIDQNKNSIICNHRWGYQKITLLLFADRDERSQEVFVIGNVPELGSWKSLKNMSLIKSRDLSSQNIIARKRQNYQGNETVFSFTFWADRNKKKIHYYYVKKSGQIQPERQPGRMIQFNQIIASRHPDCFHISYASGQIQIFQNCHFNRLNYSQITDQIFVGAYVRTQKDIMQLKDKKITHVLSIQSQRDHNLHYLSPSYLKLLCQENQIKYHTYSILDMNPQDFIEKCLGAFLILRDLLKEPQSRVYVHCSAGIYRSPQVIVLYLVLVEGYGLQEAIQLVMQKHPFARPNYEILSQALSEISRKMTHLIIHS